MTIEEAVEILNNSKPPKWGLGVKAWMDEYKEAQRIVDMEKANEY